MKDLSLTVEENKRFYEGSPDHEYQGDLISQVVVEMASPYFGDRNRFLDVGAGTGALIKRFRRYWDDDFKHIEGIDIAPKDAVVRKGDCTNMNYPGKAFDCVFCTDVIEHLNDKDLRACISEIRRILKTGGLLILTTNNKENLNQRTICCPGCGRKFHAVGHCQSFDIDKVHRLLEGFTIKKYRELNLGFIATFGALARIFYALRLHKYRPVRRIISDLFIVAEKN